MSQPRDSDDFLGWAPDLGSWETPPAPPRITPPQPPVVPAVTPQQAYQAPVRRQAPAARPPAAAPPRPQARPSSRPASRTRVPVLIAAAVMLVFTLFTALVIAVDGPRSSPALLGIFGVITALLVRIAWFQRRR